MATKNLYVLVRDNWDGSYSTVYTFNSKWIAKQQEAADNGELDDQSVGFDGDGFHYDVLKVPEECTFESLGLRPHDDAENE